MPMAWLDSEHEQLSGQHRMRPPMRFKMFGRRHFSWGHCLIRLPLLILWSVIVILIVYKSIKSTYPLGEKLNNKPQQQAVHWTTQNEPEQYQNTSSVSQQLEETTNQLLISPAMASFDGDGHDGRVIETATSSQSQRIGKMNEKRTSLPLTTTRRSPARDYMRRSEIFILIVQDSVELINKHHRSSSSSINPSGNLYPNSGARLTTAKSKNWHKLLVPVHIRQLIEILKYHRIDYTLDVMRTGLPTELLQNPKKYSVIVIDDFIKYDRLNRWARDQLDRFCRYNRIGVITYLIDNGKLNYHQSDTTSNIPGTLEKSMPREREQAPSFTISGEVKLTTKQYPMSFELLNLNCRNQTSASCLLDYQLNDKAQLLRILKRRPDFILRGDLGRNLGVRSVITMASNHATHEPLTWGQLRWPSSSSHHLNKRYATFRKSPIGWTKSIASGSRYSNYGQVSAGLTDRQKRAVLPTPTLATSGYPSDLGGDKDQDILYDNQRSSSDDYVYDTQNGQENDVDLNEGESEVVFDQEKEAPGQSHNSADDLDDKKVIAMLDHGLYDDIRRIIFGVSNQHWLNRLLLLDAIEHLSSGEILTPLERYIQIDIDDIFVGATGTRMNESDVFALIETQDYFATLLEGGFKFNLGFSGKYFKRGSETEQLGDEQLIANSDKFTWFCHFWSHSKAHLFNTTETLSMELKRNLKFALDNKLTLIGHREPLKGYDQPDNDYKQPPPTYAVAPHHSGVYPIHAQLYEAWRSILNVQITTTEEYPHLRPATQRRGFVHETIKVLPRQTCGLYTHTIFKNKYPGGFGKLMASIEGGELFETIVHNPVNIYMSHMSNYANDRLGLFTFRALFEFVQKYTNLRLKYSPDIPQVDTDDSSDSGNGKQVAGGPMFLANYYFKLHPEEREPLWTNPCDDKRHLAIWSTRKLKLCQVVPKLLIVGPQKTGTTALQSFLKLNPSIRTSLASSEDFEEVQFFNDKHYFKGSDWYFERFFDETTPPSDNGTAPGSTVNAPIFLDKSATYFDDPKVPRRVSSLLPEAHIVILLIDPADRAYSWYQHIKAHGDPIANEFSFDEVIMFHDSSEMMTTVTKTTSPPVTKLNDTSGTASTSVGPRSLTDRQIVAMKALRNRCLHPGYYSNHLLKWLNYYQSRQIVIIDGEWFKFNPKAVLNRLQILLHLPTQVDYDKLLVYHRSKGFYCERNYTSSRSHSRGTKVEIDNIGVNDHQQVGIKCLGSGKGRKYAPMSANARNYLDDHYLSHNRQLARLLYEIGQPLPSWLDQSINPLPTTVRLL